MNCGIGCRCSSDPVLLWPRPAPAAPILPLSWGLPYTVGVAIKKKKIKVELLAYTKRKGKRMGKENLSFLFQFLWF